MFVWTRFACPMKQGRNGDSELWLDPDWLHYRVHLYRQFTLASLRRQTFQDFDIILQCCQANKRLMDPYIDMLKEAGVTVVFDEGRQYFANLPSKYTKLSYVRLDSDDMYAPQALDIMRASLSMWHAVQCVGGFWWNIPRRIVRRWIRKSPPFFGITVRRRQVKEIFNVLGTRLGAHGHVKFRSRIQPAILPPGLFLVLNHAQNHRGGSGYGKKRFPIERVLPSFGITPPIWQSRKVVIPPRETEQICHQSE